MLTKEQQKIIVRFLTEEPGKGILEDTEIENDGPVTRDQLSQFAAVCQDILLEHVDQDVFAV